MTELLSHTRIAGNGATPDRWLYVLHGIYGSGRNWGSLARRLVEERPEWGVILTDLRLHGSSRNFPPPHTVAAAANDLGLLEEGIGSPATSLLGHSFGGKVALLRAAECDPVPDQVWIADSTLRTGEPSGTAWRVLEVVRGLPARFASRDEVVDALERHGYDRAMGQWLAINLERDAEGFRWRLDWEGVEELLRDYFRVDVWDTVEEPPGGMQFHVIRAARSSSIDEESAVRLRKAGERTGRVFVHEVDAGHWLNVDNPEAVMSLLVQEL
jgi:pimeloyl-ACP methyl ester carboxylesterase